MFDRIDRGLWWDFGWQLVEGCTPVSEACDNCWSLGKEKRFRKETGVKFHSERLERPLKRKKPAVFSIWNDLFHEDIDFSDISEAFSVMVEADWHVFLILTKRPERVIPWMMEHLDWHSKETLPDLPGHIMIGTTIENQEQADKRLYQLLQVPSRRFISIEPMLGEIDFYKTSATFPYQDYRHPWFNGPILQGIDWVICGGESGPKARPMHPNWAESIRDQCIPNNVPFFFKQWGEWAPIFDKSAENIRGLMDHDPWFHWKIDGVGGFMSKIGKKNAGRVLSNNIHEELPKF